MSSRASRHSIIASLGTFDMRFVAERRDGQRFSHRSRAPDSFRDEGWPVGRQENGDAVDSEPRVRTPRTVTVAT